MRYSLSSDEVTGLTHTIPTYITHPSRVSNLAVSVKRFKLESFTIRTGRFGREKYYGSNYTERNFWVSYNTRSTFFRRSYMYLHMYILIVSITVSILYEAREQRHTTYHFTSLPGNRNDDHTRGYRGPDFTLYLPMPRHTHGFYES